MADKATVHKRALDVLVKEPGLTAAEVAERVGLSDEREVRASLGRPLSLMLLATAGGGHRQQTFTDEFMIQSIQDVFRSLGTDGVSHKAYDNYRRANDSADLLPSSHTISNRFGTWAEACERAKVPTGGRRRTKYSKTWTEEQITEAVALCFSETRRASHEAYAQWAKKRNDVPRQVRITSSRNWSELARDAFDLLSKKGPLRDKFLASVGELEAQWQKENDAAA